MPKVEFKNNLCKGCGLCVLACPKKIVKISEEVSNASGYFCAEITDITKCIACGACATMCPDCVIEVENDR